MHVGEFLLKYAERYLKVFNYFFPTEIVDFMTNERFCIQFLSQKLKLSLRESALLMQAPTPISIFEGFNG